MTETLLLLGKIIILTHLLGYGFSSLALPSSLKKYSLLLSPWVYMVVAVVLGGILSLAKFPTQLSAYIVAGLSLASYAYSRSSSPHNQKVQLSLRPETFILLAILVYHALPLIVKIGYPTTLSLGNLDPVSYASVSEFLKEKTVLDGGVINVYKPSTWSIVDLIHYGYRWGPPLLLSQLSVLLGAETYQIYTLVTLFYFVFTANLLLVSLSLLGLKNLLARLMLVFLFSLNSTLMYWVYHGFLSQFLFSGLLVLALIISLSREDSKVKHAILFGFVFSATTTIYPEVSPVLILPVLLTQISSKNGFVRGALTIPMGIIISYLLNPVTFRTTYNQITRILSATTDTSFIGWELLRFPNALEILGLYNLNYSRPLGFVFGLATLFLLLWVLIISLRQLKKPILFWFFTSGVVVSIFFSSAIIDNFFAFHRSISYFIWLYILLFVAQFFGQSKSPRPLLIFSILLFSLLIRSSTRTWVQWYRHARAVDIPLISLSSCCSYNGVLMTSDVLLGEYDLWQRVWQEHFLRNQKIIDLQNHTLVEIPPFTPVLARKDKLTHYEKIIPPGKTIWENQSYILMEQAR